MNASFCLGLLIGWFLGCGFGYLFLKNNSHYGPRSGEQGKTREQLIAIARNFKNSVYERIDALAQLRTLDGSFVSVFDVGIELK